MAGIRASLAASIGLWAAACAAPPEAVVPAYVSPNAYVGLPCEEIIARLEAVEAQVRAERDARPPRPFTLRPPPQPAQRVQSLARAERSAMREAARRKECERPVKPLFPSGT